MRMSSKLFCTVAAPLLACLVPIAAHAQTPDTAVSADVAPGALTEDQADSLKPGSYLWHPDVAAAGAVNILVDLDRQIAFVYRGGTLIGISTVSTGRDGYETPVGSFTILQKQVDHKSNLYHEASMPFMERLTWDGVALHAGGVPGYRESHGCVHLPIAFAKALYDVTDIGATVELRGTPPADAVDTATTVASNDADEAPATQPGVQLVSAHNP